MQLDYFAYWQRCHVAPTIDSAHLSIPLFVCRSRAAAQPHAVLLTRVNHFQFLAHVLLIAAEVNLTALLYYVTVVD